MFFTSIFLFCQILQASSVTNFSEFSPLQWVPPSTQQWKNVKMSQNVKQYWEQRWSKAFYTKGCGAEDSLKIIPVYFWPGERVDLKCRMCQMAFVTNGRIKRWGYAKDIDDFLLNPKQFVRVRDGWADVENQEEKMKTSRSDPESSEGFIYLPNLKNKASNSSKIDQKQIKEPPKYWENEGKLSIFNTDVRSQGVYFCYDEDSKKATTLFYVLMAMIPPVKITSEHPTVFNDNCGADNGEDGSKIGPSHNWRYHFLPMADLHPPVTCQIDPSADLDNCQGKFEYLKKENWPKNLDEDCSIEKCRARLHSPERELDIFVEMRWDDWTSCEGEKPTKRREAHCYLVRGQGSINIELMAKKTRKLYNWVKNLETVFDQKPFNSEGIRLHSSLLVSAIFDRERLVDCYNEKDDDDDLYELYDDIWRKVFLPTFAVVEDKDTNQLKNPFEACLRFGRTGDVEHLIGTYATQVDYC